MRWIRGLILGLLMLTAGNVVGDEKKEYATGYKAPADLAERKVRAAERNAAFAFPRTTATRFDWREHGIVPPIVDQRDCGSCWDFDGCGVCTMAAIKAGVGKADGSFRLSEQYVLDCVPSGGCGGDDHSTVFDHALKHGLPTETDYGPYQAREGKCKSVTRFVKLKGWGYCDAGARGPASVQSIKDALVAKGPIGVAIAADSAFMNARRGSVFKDSGSRRINHEVIIVGFDDEKNAFCVRNSWGTGYCDDGYVWVDYHANAIGTDAAWAEVESVVPPAPPAPPAPPVAPLIPPWLLQLLIAIISALGGVVGGKWHERATRGF